MKREDILISLCDEELTLLLREDKHWFTNTVYTIKIAGVEDVKEPKEMQVLVKQVFKAEHISFPPHTHLTFSL